MTDRRQDDVDHPFAPGALSILGPIHVFAGCCFYVFGLIYLAFIHSAYLCLSNFVFGTLCLLHFALVARRPRSSLHANTFLAIVYLGLVNVVVHLGASVFPMVFWGMSISIAAAFLNGVPGVVAWLSMSLLFYPLNAYLKAGPLAHRAIALDPDQTALLAFATYAGLLSFLGFTFLLFSRRLDRALEALRSYTDALRESESFLAETQRVAHIGTYDYDVQTGTWTSSPLLDKIFGIDAEFARDVSGWLSVVHSDERDAMAHHLQAVLAGPESFDREYRLSRTDGGQEVWVHGRGVVHRDAQGRPLRLIGTVQDVSASRRGEEERRRLEARLYQAQKLESLGVLAGGIAHDFNNLLTGILGNIGLAETYPPQSIQERLGALRAAETAAMRAAELTRQMLAFSGKGHFVIQPLDLNAALTEMVALLRSNLPPKVVIRFDLCAKAPRIMADASQIRQVIMNLLLNAGEAIGADGGDITIRSSVRHVDAGQTPGGFCSEGFTAGEHACIEIADSGCGMDATVLARIFDPFFTTKFTGRGLGLAAVLGIVQGHGGCISVDSKPGSGTTFTLLFPLAGEGEGSESKPNPMTADDKGVGQVLVVDDEPVVRQLVCAVLQGAGYEVLQADGGAQGLEILGQHPTGIDLVLLDLTMPGISGVELFRELKRTRPELRVVVMSGYTRSNVAKLFADVAPNDFLEKPFQAEQLLTVVRRVLGR